MRTMATTWNGPTALPWPPTPKAPPVANKRTGRAKILLPVLLALATAGGGVAYAAGAGAESTDDAQVEGHLVNVASRIPGQVARVMVKDNQVVEAGDVLVEIDDRDY